jgi:hypothetical protein
MPVKQRATTPAQNTKLELLAEAIEGMCNVVAAKAMSHVLKRTAPKAVNDALDNARGELRTALGGFLAPALRIVDGGPQALPISIPARDRVKCAVCSQVQPCSPHCADWQKAIRANIEKPRK